MAASLLVAGKPSVRGWRTREIPGAITAMNAVVLIRELESGEDTIFKLAFPADACLVPGCVRAIGDVKSPFDA